MTLEEMEMELTRLSGGSEFVGSLVGRMRVAMSFGYVDARSMVYLKETYGYPLADSALQASKRGFKIDFGGLRYELEKIGKKPEAIESELEEVRYFLKVGEGR